MAHFDGAHQLQPLRDAAKVKWSLQHLYRADNRRRGHLGSFEHVRATLDGLKVKQVCLEPCHDKPLYFTALHMIFVDFTFLRSLGFHTPTLCGEAR